MIRNRALGSFYLTNDHLNFTAWGIADCELNPCEILLVGLGKGFSRDQKERLKTIGVDLAIIWGGRTSEQAGGYAAGRVHVKPIKVSLEFSVEWVSRFSGQMSVDLYHLHTRLDILETY
jgi:hypothetical protein